MKLSILISCLLVVLLMPVAGFAQDATSTETEVRFTGTSTLEDLPPDATTTAAAITEQNRTIESRTNDTTKPEQFPEKVAILSLFDERPIAEPSILSFMGYWVQQAVTAGIPANTIFLILLTPLLATLVSFTRIVIGLPTLDMLVPIALAFAFVAVGIEVGMLVLGAIIFAAYVSKISLQKLQIMFYPKRSLSMFFLALFVFAALTVALGFEFERVVNLSIFPILILILLGDSIVSVQLHKSATETLVITGTTLALGLLGFIAATSTMLQNTLILYPEIVLLAIPLNLLIGRYFGLRLLEYLRFSTLSAD